MFNIEDQQKQSENWLLAALPREAYNHLLPNLEHVSFTLRLILYEPNGAMPYVYFPLEGVVSQIITMQDGQAVEVATIGKEGMVGLPVFLGVDSIPAQAFVQIPGEALRMPSDIFRDESRQAGPLRDVLQRYTEALFMQVAQSSACNRVHSIDQRCARWLLMSEDRMGKDTFELTQEFLSQMLGVRRASVSEVASRLQQAGLIQYNRGIITILDRPGLEAVSCECYWIIEREYERLLR